MRLGGGLLCKAQGWFGDLLGGVSWWQMVIAIALLLGGLAIIGSALGIKPKHKHYEFSEDGVHCSCGDGDESNAIFSNADESYEGREFTGKEINGVFGSYELDLRGAIVPADCSIEINSVFGRVVVRTGDTANYKVVQNRVFGSVTGGSKAPVEGLPTITIEATSVFGAVEIR